MKKDLSKTLIDNALELAWSLWAELGVSGWQRHHTSHAIDLEWLILYTAGLCERDPRLRDEATDWCIRSGKYISGSRLRNLIKQMNGSVMSRYGTFAATVNAHSIHRLPEAGKDPLKFEPTGRSQPPDLLRPSLLTLRLRASFGVTARAEVIRLYLCNPDGEYAASDLAPETGYTKRNIADALENLGASGILEALRVKNQIRYRLLDRRSLFAFVGNVPEVFPRWSLVMPLMLEMVELVNALDKSSDRVSWVEASKLLAGFDSSLRYERIHPPAPPSPDLGWATFVHWAVNISEAWAQGRFDKGRVAIHPADVKVGVH